MVALDTTNNIPSSEDPFTRERRAAEDDCTSFVLTSIACTLCNYMVLRGIFGDATAYVFFCNTFLMGFKMFTFIRRRNLFPYREVGIRGYGSMEEIITHMQTGETLGTYIIGMQLFLNVCFHFISWTE
jgi:hypothetical protein